jgi:pimeloyl-ACP methyl ester carboxylesterase
MVKPALQIPAWLQQLYPFSPHNFLTPQGARMSYVDEGPRVKEAVLMLHGNPTWSFFYRDLIRDLSPNVRCIAPDHIGMGLSDKPEAYDYTLARRVADVAALIESLGLKRVHLVVHDWGGAIGFGLAAQRPELIGKITILNTAAFVSQRIPRRISICRWPLLGPFLVRALNGFAGPATWMSVHQRKLSHDEKRAYLFPYGNWADRVAVSAFVQDIPLEADHVSRSTLTAIERSLAQFTKHPKLIVWGARDFCFNAHFLKRWIQIFPEAELVELKDAGHYVLEDGGELTRSRIVAFLLKP